MASDGVNGQALRQSGKDALFFFLSHRPRLGLRRERAVTVLALATGCAAFVVAETNHGPRLSTVRTQNNFRNHALKHNTKSTERKR